MGTFLRDVRFALRSLVRQPGVSLVIVLTVAVGIGANTGIFALLIEVYASRFPAPEPERLFYVRTGTPERPFGLSSQPDAADYREALEDLGDVASWIGFGSVVGLPGSGEARGRAVYCVGLAVSPEYFDFFGVRFAHGRGFHPEEGRPGAPGVAVLDYTFWSRDLEADPSIVGRTIHVNSIPYTVVGVAPWGFQGHGNTRPIYIPLPHADDVWPRPVFADRDFRRFGSMLRLGKGATRQEAAARLEVVAKSLDAEHPWPNGAERRVSLRGVEERDAGPDVAALMIMTAMGLLLLLACANVANLLLVRAAGRQREIAVMAAVGASRRRIAARLLVESVTLSTLGGFLGLGVARPLSDLVKRLLEVKPVGLGTLGEATQWAPFDHRVLLFAFFVSVATGCLFGLAPILFAVRADLVSALKGTALETKPGRRFGTRQALVLLQVVFSTVLLLGAGLMIRSLRELEYRDMGFDTEPLLLVTMATAPPRLESPAARHDVQRRLYEKARRRLAEVPGVRSAALISEPLAGGYARSTRLVLAERGDETLTVDNFTVDGGFFETVSIPLYGRTFDERDRAGGMGAAIVNRAFVDRYWDDVEPLGRELRLPDLATDTADDRFVVVGVAADVRHASRYDKPEPLVYVPFSQHLWGSRMTLTARTSQPRQLQPEVYEALAFVDPDLALADVATYDDVRVFDLQGSRALGAISGLFSLLGLGVACVGIYSVMSCSVSYRVREIGIRMALGADARDIVRLVLGEAGGLVTAGALLGVAAALALARLLSSLLYGVTAHDPWTFLPLPLLLVAVALAAAWLPARRAGRLDPKTALLEE